MQNSGMCTKCAELRGCCVRLLLRYSRTRTWWRGWNPSSWSWSARRTSWSSATRPSRAASSPTSSTKTPVSRATGRGEAGGRWGEVERFGAGRATGWVGVGAGTRAPGWLLCGILVVSSHHFKAAQCRTLLLTTIPCVS